MAKRSVLLNNLDEKIDIVNGDIKTASQIFGAAVLMLLQQIHHI